ncbi:M56 family metallopeptidase [uncultured Chitinophaga sp.]|jgi:Antirepressor regulating drug resistance, predicted signal transduction N-terminal membrane component|uniref:M56 family metallopeptidase n=1 Tax=uncultured Chitinophaga sp. TaxID=339340 RepID=UPI00260661EA|nr:M56 family metallopeptidase [uncultured Chitinophaga sp.]
MVFLPFTAELVTALGWAILHSLWQALLVFICLRIVLKLWPDATSATKYNLSVLSLAGIFGWFVATLYKQLEAVKAAHFTAGLPVTGTPGAPLVLQAPAVYQSQEELHVLFPNLEMVFPLLVALYIAGVAVMCIKLVADLAQLRQIRKKLVLPADSAWEHYLDKVKQQLRIPRKVQLLISQYVQVPVMIGFLKPVILVPAAMFNNLSAEQLEAILLHELAHIKRNDYILNIFQSIVETTLFFNPFVWWISKFIRLEREHCCDDMVLAHTSQPLHYAKALVALEEYRFTTNPMVMAAADNKQHLLYRIKRIMEMKTSHLNYSQKFMAMLIIAVGLTAIAWITPSANQDKDQTTAAAPASQSAFAANTLPLNRLLTDTVPPKVNNASPQPENTNTDNNSNAQLDEADLEKMEQDRKEAHQKMREMNEQMKAVHEQVRVAREASQKAVQEAMKNIDWKAINAQTQEALKAVDWKKINQEIENSMKSIDWSKINQEIKESVKEGQQSVDPEMIRKSVEMGMKSAQMAMANIDLETIIKNSMNAANRGISEANRAMMRKNMDDVRDKQRDAMREAREKMAEAREKEREARAAELGAKRAEMNAKRAETKTEATRKHYQELVSKLTDDKLIDPSKGYTIEKKNNDLYINGNKQSAAVMDKYRAYLGAGRITIKGEKDNMNVDVRD